MTLTAASPTHGQKVSIPALDGLRGVAVIGVLLFHDERLTGGFLGVDLFFALSGMLITGLLIEEWSQRSRIDLRRFWSRRFRRLLPALVLMLLAIVPLMRLWGSPTQLQSAKDGVLPGLFYLSNWQQIAHSSDYWALFSDPSPLTHLWSLAVEAQFYVAWPLLFVVVARLARPARWRTALTLLTTALIALSGALMWVQFDPRFPTRSYVGTDTRAASLLAGALVALVGLPGLIQRFAERRRWLVQVGQVALVAGLVAAWCTVDGATSTLLPKGGLVLHSLAGAVLAASLGLSRPTMLQRALAIRPLRAAGLVSYGWYLWHWPVYLVLTTDRADNWGINRWELSALRWGVSLTIALASYFVLEMPIRRRTALQRPFAAPIGFALSLALIVGAATLVPQPTTAPTAFDPGSIELPTTVPTTSPTSAPSSTTPTPTTAAVPRRTVDRIIWEGDSVADNLGPGVIAAFEAAGVTATYAGYAGTGYVAREGVDTFMLFVQPVLDLRPDVVVMQLSGWDSLFSKDEQRAGFEKFTTTILDTGAAIVFVTHPPVDTSKAKVDTAVMLDLARQLSTERPDDVWVLDASEFWGPFAYDIDSDGVPDRKKDGAHVCPQGSARLGNWLVNELAALFAGIAPKPPTEWAGGPWVTDPMYDIPAGSCQ